MPVDGDALFSNGKCTDVRAYFCVKYRTTHAQVRRRLLSPDETREK
jgi:hypothetical protein